MCAGNRRVDFPNTLNAAGNEALSIVPILEAAQLRKYFSMAREILFHQ